MLHKTADLALQAYLDNLIDVSEPSDTNQALASASQLLKKANEAFILNSNLAPSPPEKEFLFLPSTDLEPAVNTIELKEKTNSVETVSRSPVFDLLPLQERLSKKFQVLFFEVAELTLAIPLADLGGIIKMQPLSKVPSNADWFMGVLVNKTDKYQCVDTAKWIGSRGHSNALQQTTSYQYAVQLGKTSWVLACSNLATTHELAHEDIKWRDQGKSRPWLAGTIKQKMCALIDAGQLINLLESKPTI